METIVLKVKGMSCGGCVSSVTRVLSSLPGVTKVEVTLERGEARVEYGAAADVAQFKSAIEDAGFEVAV